MEIAIAIMRNTFSNTALYSNYLSGGTIWAHVNAERAILSLTWNGKKKQYSNQ